jgi:hypothetical protein
MVRKGNVMDIRGKTRAGNTQSLDFLQKKFPAGKHSVSAYPTARGCSAVRRKGSPATSYTKSLTDFSQKLTAVRDMREIW